MQMLNKFEKESVSFSSKKVIVFDLDGTLTESKANLDKEMASLLCKLLEKKTIAVIGGGYYPQFKKQFLNHFKCPKSQLKNLLLLPTSGGRMYKYNREKWQILYKNDLTAQERNLIISAFKKSFRDINYIQPKKIYGKVIEDRGSQISFSAVGQKAPLEKKEEWNKKQDIRPKLKMALEKYLSEFEVRFGGFTSVDVTKKGIDKAYGIEQIMKLLSLSVEEMVFIGDALYEGGNDFAVMRTKIDAIRVSDFKETKRLIRKLILKYS